MTSNKMSPHTAAVMGGLRLLSLSRLLPLLSEFGIIGIVEADNATGFSVPTSSDSNAASHPISSRRAIGLPRLSPLTCFLSFHLSVGMSKRCQQCLSHMSLATIDFGGVVWDRVREGSQKWHG